MMATNVQIWTSRYATPRLFDCRHFGLGLVPKPRQLVDGLAQRLVAEVGVVAGRDAHIGMAEQFGNGQQVHAQLRQGAGVGVAATASTI